MRPESIRRMVDLEDADIMQGKITGSESMLQMRELEDGDVIKGLNGKELQFVEEP